jgi:flagellum-specific peptidoglycan hydrolase FlgJ
LDKKHALLNDRQEQLDFIASIAPAAQASEKKYGVPASVTIAQAILESAWGKRAIGNNYFGIKARVGEAVLRVHHHRVQPDHQAEAAGQVPRCSHRRRPRSTRTAS